MQEYVKIWTQYYMMQMYAKKICKNMLKYAKYAELESLLVFCMFLHIYALRTLLMSARSGESD